MIRRRPSLWRAEHGGSMVESVEIMAALLLLILGIFAAGSIYWAWNTMLLAVEQAGRYAMLYNPTAYPGGPPAATCGGGGDLGTCAVAWAGNTGFGTVTCTSGCNGAGSTITFTAQYNFDFVYPITMYRVMTFPLI
jgi:Flp pilus assembly protein TadG